LERQTALSLEARRLTQALDDVVRLTRLRAQAGASTQVDPTVAQGRRDGAVLTELSIRSRLEQTRSRWQSISGDRAATAGPQAGPWPLDMQPVAPLTAGAAFAGVPEPDDPRYFDDAPALRAALQDVEAARAALDTAKAARLPSVTLDASVGRPLDRSLLLSNRSDTSLTVNLNAPLYQGGAGDAQVRAAVAALQAAQSRLDSVRRTVQERWRDAELQLLGALSRMPALQQRLLTYNDSRRLYREQYLQLGNRSILDFLNAEQELYLSRTELLNAEYDARQNKLQSLHAAGQLRAFFALSLEAQPRP
jgi:adhesin transport system outer membrane protein